MEKFKLLKNPEHIYDTERLVNRLFVLESKDVENIQDALNPVLKLLRNKALNSNANSPFKKSSRKSYSTKIKDLNIEPEENELVESIDKDILKDNSFNLSNFIKKDPSKIKNEDDFEYAGDKEFNVVHVEKSGKFFFTFFVIFF
jgi:hypothetical protein